MFLCFFQLLKPCLCYTRSRLWRRGLGCCHQLPMLLLDPELGRVRGGPTRWTVGCKACLGRTKACENLRDTKNTCIICLEHLLILEDIHLKWIFAASSSISSIGSVELPDLFCCASRRFWLTYSGSWFLCSSVIGCGCLRLNGAHRCHT